MPYIIIDNLKEINFTKYERFLSIGSNCFPKRLIDVFFGKDQTMLFDYIGISMWSIINLVKDYKISSDFIDGDYKYIQTIEGGDTVMTNLKYYIRPIHDFKEYTCPPEGLDLSDLSDQAGKLALFRSTYNRRVIRFNEFLENSKKKKKKFMFIRFYESSKNRIMYPEIKDYYDSFYTPRAVMNRLSCYIEGGYPPYFINHPVAQGIIKGEIRLPAKGKRTSIFDEEK